MKILSNTALVTFAILAAPLGAEPDPTVAPLSPSAQFELIKSWEGRWQVAETPALEIVFEETARGSTMVERWETASGLHSITVYHMDGEILVATHSCPQGNQPRLESRSDGAGEIRFQFRDVADLDVGESHTHELWFAPGDDGTLRRTEVYRGADGLQDPSSYTLSRATVGD